MNRVSNYAPILPTEYAFTKTAGSVASDEDFENQRRLAIDVVKSIKSFGSNSNFGIVTFSNEAIVRVPFRPGHSRAQAIKTIEGWRRLPEHRAGLVKPIRCRAGEHRRLDVGRARRHRGDQPDPSEQARRQGARRRAHLGW